MNIPWWGLGLVLGAALSAGACFGALVMAAVAAGKRADDRYIIAVLHKAIDEVIGWMEHAPFDSSNGVTDPTGTVDEGNVVGWRYHGELLDILLDIRKAKQDD